MSTTFLLWYRWTSKLESMTRGSVSLAGREWMVIMKMKIRFFKEIKQPPYFSVNHETTKVVFLRGDQNVFQVFRCEGLFSRQTQPEKRKVETSSFPTVPFRASNSQ